MSKTLHIFNPEHDIALAANLSNFTAPHAGRQLRADLGFLPALWAREGDVVLVGDEDTARRAWRKLRLKSVHAPATPHMPYAPVFVSPVPHVSLPADIDRIEPWGWDRALVASLERCGVAPELLPSAAALDEIRLLSHRRTASQLLPALRIEGTVGESCECRDAAEVESLLERHRRIVLKAPWSSSGRGLRFLSAESHPVAQQAGWLRNLLKSQGTVMVEPYYNKVKDFGMEFEAHADGTVGYKGLSLFLTANGAYAGNLLATEKAKWQMLERYIPGTLLAEVRELLCRQLAQAIDGRYAGPLGVDMMVVATARDSGGEGWGAASSAFLLHPCVEINLRRTMGHVALALSPDDDERLGVMRIEYTGTNYKLKLKKL